MAAFNYAESAATARELLKDFGQPMAFASSGAGSGPPGVPTTPSAGQTVSGTGVILSYKNAEIDGTVIQTGDAKVIIEATDSAPKIGMTSTINGKTWRVKDVSPLSPAGVVVMYTLKVRRV